MDIQWISRLLGPVLCICTIWEIFLMYLWSYLLFTSTCLTLQMGEGTYRLQWNPLHISFSWFWNRLRVSAPLLVFSHPRSEKLEYLVFIDVFSVWLCFILVLRRTSWLEDYICLIWNSIKYGLIYSTRVLSYLNSWMVDEI